MLIHMLAQISYDLKAKNSVAAGHWCGSAEDSSNTFENDAFIDDEDEDFEDDNQYKPWESDLETLIGDERLTLADNLGEEIPSVKHLRPKTTESSPDAVSDLRIWLVKHDQRIPPEDNKTFIHRVHACGEDPKFFTKAISAQETEIFVRRTTRNQNFELGI